MRGGPVVGARCGYLQYLCIGIIFDCRFSQLHFVCIWFLFGSGGIQVHGMSRGLVVQLHSNIRPVRSRHFVGSGCGHLQHVHRGILFRPRGGQLHGVHIRLLLGVWEGQLHCVSCRVVMQFYPDNWAMYARDGIGPGCCCLPQLCPWNVRPLRWIGCVPAVPFPHIL